MEKQKLDSRVSLFWKRISGEMKLSALEKQKLEISFIWKTISGEMKLDELEKQKLESQKS